MISRSKLFFLKSLMLMTLFSICDAKDYYVSSKKGKDSNSGTSKRRAFKSINKAAKIAKAGDTVYVMNGIYYNKNFGKGNKVTNRAVVTISNSGNKKQGPIVFRNLAGEKPKLRFDGSSGIQLNKGVSNVIIDGFEIEGIATSISYSQALAKRNELAGIGKRTGIANTYYEGRGIVGWGPHKNIEVRNCKVCNTPGSGIRFNGADYVTVEDCVVGQTCWWSSKAESAIVFAETKANDSRNDSSVKMIFRRNVVYDNWNRIPFFTSKNQPNGKNPKADYGTAKQNYILDGQGLYVTRSSPSYKGTFLIENNVCVNNGKNGINFDGSKSATAIIRNNTLYNNGSHNFIQSKHEGPNLVAGVAVSHIGKAIVANNVIVSRKEGKEYRGIAIWDNSAIEASNNILVNCVLHRNLKQGTNLSSTKPIFIDPSNDYTKANFHLRKGSQAVNFGSTSELHAAKEDFTKKGRRDLKPDAGAFESFNQK